MSRHVSTQDTGGWPTFLLGFERFDKVMKKFDALEPSSALSHSRWSHILKNWELVWLLKSRWKFQACDPLVSMVLRRTALRNYSDRDEWYRRLP